MAATERRTRQRVVVTRAADQSAELTGLLTRLGVEVVAVPTIRTADPVDGGEALGAALDEIDRFAWLVVTSPNGARRVMEGLALRHPDGLPEGVRIAAVGPGTAAVVTGHGVHVDLVPQRHLAEGLVEEFPEPADPDGDGGSVPDDRDVLVASADIARDVVPRGLGAKGWDVTVVDAYRTIPVEPTAEQLERLEGADVITFASGSAVRALVDAVGVASIPSTVVTIGPVASAAARAAGLRVAAEADPHTIRGLVEAVARVL